jgi:hypothetical protein
MAGYPSASNTTSNLPQSTVKFYDKNFIENLKAETPFVRCAERRDLPVNSGNQLVLFEYGYRTRTKNKLSLIDSNPETATRRKLAIAA